MIQKISLIAGTSALMLATAVVPSFATFTMPSLPNINAQVNYVDSQSAAVANTGNNAQFAALPTQPTGVAPSMRMGDDHHQNGNGTTTKTDTSLYMETGQACSVSNSTVDIASKLTGGNANSDRNKGKYGRYDNHNGTQNSTIGVSANIVLSRSQASANTGDNLQNVGSEPVLVPVSTTNTREGGYNNNRGTSGNTTTNTNLYMKTGVAQAVSNSTVSISATNVSGRRM